MIRGGQSGAGGSWCWLVKIQCCRLKQGRRVWQWSHDSPYQNHTRLSHTQHHAFLTTQLVSVSVIQCQCITISHSQCSVQILFTNIMPRHSGSVLFSLFHAFFVGPTLSSACPSEPFESRISSTFSFYSLSRFVPVQSNDLIWSDLICFRRNKKLMIRWSNRSLFAVGWSEFRNYRYTLQVTDLLPGLHKIKLI